MSKNKKMRTMFPLLACLTLVGCSSSINSINNEASQEGIVTEGLSNGLKDEYQMFETLDVPTYTFKKGEKEVVVNGRVVFPDKTLSVDKQVFLDQSGIYKVKYMANIDGEDFYHEETFKVLRKLFTYTSPNTKVSSFPKELPSYAKPYTTTNGVYVQLGLNDTLTVNKPINVSDLVAGNEDVGEDVIKGFVTPMVQAVADYSRMTFRLTDVNNPGLYCEFRFDINNSYPGTVYWKGAGHNQIMTGWNQEGGAAPKSKITTAATLGAVAPTSYDASVRPEHAPTDPSSSPFRFRYDSQSMTGYDSYIHVYDKVQYHNHQEIVSLKDPNAFGSMWPGFKSDKVILSIYCDGYTDKTANFCITDILGFTREELENEYLNDVTPPTINVDTTYDLNKMPKGKKGTKYLVPTATATDDYDKDVSVSTSVYYGFNSSNPISINIDENNKFDTKYNGVYTIVYEASDTNGNVAQKCAQVLVGEDYQPISANIDSSLTDCDAGQTINIPELKNLKGGSGDYNIEITATHSSGLTGEIKYNKFTPLEVGEWTISYKVTDYLGISNTFSKKITAKTSNRIVPIEFDTKPYQGMINGLSYDVPNAKAYKFDKGYAEIVNCDVYIDETKYSVGQQFKPSVAESGDEIEFVIKLGDATLKTFTTFAIITYDSEETLYPSNLFYEANGNKDEVTIEKTNDGIAVTQSNSNNVIRFHKKLIANNFLVGIKKIVADTELPRFNKITVTICDTENENQKVSVILQPTSINGAKLILNDGSSYDVALANTSDIGYANNNISFNTVGYGLSKYDNGDEFNGFDSSFVNFSISADIDSTNDTEPQYAIITLNNHSFKTKRDNTAPEYQILGEYGGRFNVGETYTVGKLICNDVISPKATALLTVLDAEGNPVTAKDGTVLSNVTPDKEYDFVVSTIGRYSVNYNLSDECKDLSSIDNKGSFNYLINCSDSEGPTIKVTSKWTENANIGATIVMPNFEVSDNVSPTDKITVIKSVRNPAGNIVILEGKSNSIVAKLAGTYVFKINAMDEQGNSTVMNFECVVK